MIFPLGDDRPLNYLNELFRIELSSGSLPRLTVESGRAGLEPAIAFAADDGGLARTHSPMCRRPDVPLREDGRQLVVP